MADGTDYKVENWSLPYVFNIAKPVGRSSFDVVRSIKKILPKKSYQKIGYFGTLDPFAEGILLVALNGANRLNDLVHHYSPKTYRAVGLLGIETDTQDCDGHVLQQDTSSYASEVIAQFSTEFLQQQVNCFIGKYWQTPPQYSATKFQGKKLCEWAREGVLINKEAVQREIYDLKIEDHRYPEVHFSATVSSGTYIRTLFTEMAQKIGSIGHLKALQRSSIGKVNLQDAVLLDEIEQFGASAFWKAKLELTDLLPFPIWRVNELQAKDFIQGKVLTESMGNFLAAQPYTLNTLEQDQYFWISFNNQLLGIVSKKNNDILKVHIGFGLQHLL